MIVLLAAKSFVIAGATLLILRLMSDRSASDRSWIAHLGLAAIAALPLVSALFPPLEVASSYASALAPAVSVSSTQLASSVWPQTATDWLLLAYLLPALLLIAHLMLALLRLALLTERARPVTDDRWLAILSSAQHRIGLSKSTALLASEGIASPVSWGALRPKILLNADAVASQECAEAVVAHELAHIARADWLKLILVRLSVALFWFNPLAWMLAREAHQLREEAADDAVLAANIEDTAYASLLVNTARNHGIGIVFGTHGVAPTRNALAQRVKKVLDRDLNRSPGRASWATAVALFAVALSTPLMTLQLTDTTPSHPNSVLFAKGENAEIIVFELRAPHANPGFTPASSQEDRAGEEE